MKLFFEEAPTMKNAKHYTSDLRRLISGMSKSPERYCKNPGRDYTRNRKITMKDVLTSTICFAGKSMSNELLQYFSCKPNFPTASAFSQQRDKLSENAFPELFQQFSRKNIPNRQINGYRLLAVDGSTLCTPANPKEKDSYFPSKNNARHFNLLHIHAMYDLLGNAYVDAIVEGGQVFNECAAFNRMVDRSYISKAIVMTDRGYEAFNTMAHCIEKGWMFLIRVKDGSSASVTKCLSLPEGEFDLSFSLVLGRSRTKEARAIPDYKPLASNTTFDFLPASSRNSTAIDTYQLRFRVIRFRLPNSSFETLITNLPNEDFPTNDVSKLYSMRWGIETSFRYLKKNIGLDFLHSKKVESICQEIFARLIAYNLTALVAYHTAYREMALASQAKPSFSNAAFICRKLILKDISPQEAEACIARCLTSVIPNRSVPRGSSHKRPTSFNHRLA